MLQRTHDDLFDIEAAREREALPRRCQGFVPPLEHDLIRRHVPEPSGDLARLTFGRWRPRDRPHGGRRISDSVFDLGEVNGHRMNTAPILGATKLGEGGGKIRTRAGNRPLAYAESSDLKARGPSAAVAYV